MHWDGGEPSSESRLAEIGFDPDDRAPAAARSLLARALEGFPRHLSIHVGGFVLSAAPLVERRARRAGAHAGPHGHPLGQGRHRRRSASSRSTCSASACSRRSASALALIHDATASSAPTAATSRSIRSSALARDPRRRIPPSTTRVCRADTVGVFQIESRAQMAMLPRLRPRTLLRSRDRGRDRAPGPDPGRHGASVPAPPHRRRERRSRRTRSSTRSSSARSACRSSRSR